MLFDNDDDDWNPDSSKNKSKSNTINNTANIDYNDDWNPDSIKNSNPDSIITSPITVPKPKSLFDDEKFNKPNISKPDIISEPKTFSSNISKPSIPSSTVKPIEIISEPTEQVMSRIDDSLEPVLNELHEFNSNHGSKFNFFYQYTAAEESDKKRMREILKSNDPILNDSNVKENIESSLRREDDLMGEACFCFFAQVKHLFIYIL